jgi:hypothetical protein
MEIGANRVDSERVSAMGEVPTPRRVTSCVGNDARMS